MFTQEEKCIEKLTSWLAGSFCKCIIRFAIGLAGFQGETGGGVNYVRLRRPDLADVLVDDSHVVPRLRVWVKNLVPRVLERQAEAGCSLWLAAGRDVVLFDHATASCSYDKAGRLSLVLVSEPSALAVARLCRTLRCLQTVLQGFHLRGHSNAALDELLGCDFISQFPHFLLDCPHERFCSVVGSEVF
jgi:hypothetical protein